MAFTMFAMSCGTDGGSSDGSVAEVDTEAETSVEDESNDDGRGQSAEEADTSADASRKRRVAVRFFAGLASINERNQEFTKAIPYLEAWIKIDPSNTHSRAGNQPQNTAMAGPTMGPVPAMLVKWCPKMTCLRVGT